MADELLSKVKALLSGGHGDLELLRSVRRACENGDDISDDERRYVLDLDRYYMAGK